MNFGITDFLNAGKSERRNYVTKKTLGEDEIQFSILGYTKVLDKEQYGGGKLDTYEVTVVFRGSCEDGVEYELDVPATRNQKGNLNQLYKQFAEADARGFTFPTDVVFQFVRNTYDGGWKWDITKVA